MATRTYADGLRASLRAGPMTKEIHALDVSRMRPAGEITQTPATELTTLRQLMPPPAYSCPTSVGRPVFQLPLVDVPSPKSSDQLVMSPSGSLLPTPRKLMVSEHSEAWLKPPQAQVSKPDSVPPLSGT